MSKGYIIKFRLVRPLVPSWFGPSSRWMGCWLCLSRIGTLQFYTGWPFQQKLFLIAASMNIQLKNSFIEKALVYIVNKKSFSAFLADMGWQDWMNSISNNREFLFRCWQDAQEIQRWQF